MMIFPRLKLYIALIITQVTAGEICTRPVCEYNFTVRYSRSMTYRELLEPPYHSKEYNIKYNGSEFMIEDHFDRPAGPVPDPEQVTTLDGVRLNYIVINDQFPGPTIEVMEGSEVVIHVANHFVHTALTIHWHGLHQRGTPWMDGTNHITQCDILPLMTYTYRFKADPAGTHWYHSHTANQHMDGGFGMIIIHRALPVLPYFPLLAGDWFHTTALNFHVSHPYNSYYQGPGDMHVPFSDRPYGHDGVEVGALFNNFSVMINGKGRYDPDVPTPLEAFYVSSGAEVLFHTINVGSEFGLEVSVDQHLLTIYESDGYLLTPTEVTSVVVFPGERILVGIKPNTEPIDAYWIRARTLGEGIGSDVNSTTGKPYVTEGLAILAYVPDPSEPTTVRDECSEQVPCLVYNCPFRGYAAKQHTTCLSLNEITSPSTTNPEERYFFGLDDDDVVEIFLNFGFNFGSAVNGRKFLSPSIPPLIHGEGGFSTCPDNCPNGCLCSHAVRLPYNRTIQMIISNLESPWESFYHHPVHMHGHNFAVLHIGYPEYSNSTGRWVAPNPDVQCDTTMCEHPSWSGQRPTLNLVNPPVKDTLVAPARGYAVIRFRAENPGYWLMHCHAEQHLMEGMILLLAEATDHLPQNPSNLPTCNHFTTEEYEELHQQAHSHFNDSCGHPAALGDDVKNNISDGTLFVFTQAEVIGGMVGFFLLGSILQMIAFCIWKRCSRSKETQHAAEPGRNYGNINPAYSTHSMDTEKMNNQL